MDLREVANPVRGQLNRENLKLYFPVPVRSFEFGLLIRFQPSRPASACSFSTLRLNPVLTHGISPDFRGGVHLFIPPSGQSRIIRPRISIPMAFTTESPPAHNGYCLCITMDQSLCASLFPHPLLVYWYEVGILRVSEAF